MNLRLNLNLIYFKFRGLLDIFQVIYDCGAYRGVGLLVHHVGALGDFLGVLKPLIQQLRAPRFALQCGLEFFRMRETGDRASGPSHHTVQVGAHALRGILLYRVARSTLLLEQVLTEIGRAHV